MDHLAEKSVSHPKRIYRTISERRRIVELAMEEGRSVAQVARQEGINTNQLFRWRREYLAGLLQEESSATCHLLPVHVDTDDSVDEDPAELDEVTAPVYKDPDHVSRGSIHINIENGRTAITAESGIDPKLLRVALEALRR